MQSSETRFAMTLYVNDYEREKGRYFRSFEEEEYLESVRIMRQYQVLSLSLSDELRVFLDEYMIDNKDYNHQNHFLKKLLCTLAKELMILIHIHADGCCAISKRFR